MSDLTPTFPQGLDVFIPLIDGYSPIAASDINLQQRAIERLEQALGFGELRSGAWGPKGSQASVADRLDMLLDRDGALHDVAFVTGSTEMRSFSEFAQGHYISFGKRITGASIPTVSTQDPGYVVLFSFEQDDTATEPQGLAYPYVVDKTEYGCRMCALNWEGKPISLEATSSVRWALLAFGASIAPVV